MRRIPLTQGRSAIVDDLDYESLSRFKWHWKKPRKGRSGTGYAVRTICLPIRRQQAMHRLIINAGSSVQVDHRNGDGLDNRRQNLRVATQRQNSCNRGKTSRNTSGFKGVYWCAKSGKWRPQIQVNGKFIHCGRFADKEAAASAYEEMANQHHGEFAHA